jgi:hypothetical protein
MHRLRLFVSPPGSGLPIFEAVFLEKLTLGQRGFSKGFDLLLPDSSRSGIVTAKSGRRLRRATGNFYLGGKNRYAKESIGGRG